MTRTRPVVLAALALAAAPLTPLAADTPQGDVETTAEAPEALTKGEKRLARMLEGRVAGEPRSCIQTLPTQRSVTIDGTAYVYGSGRTIWVQRTKDPERIDDRDALVIIRYGGTQLCRNDQMTTIDPLTGIFTGVVFFEDFVPYTRVPSPAADG